MNIIAYGIIILLLTVILLAVAAVGVFVFTLPVVYIERIYGAQSFLLLIVGILSILGAPMVSRG